MRVVPHVGRTIRIVAPHFVAGADVVDGRVVHCAPIIGYMRGWTETRVIDYVMKKGWDWSNV